MADRPLPRLHVTRFVVNGQLVTPGTVYCATEGREITLAEWLRPCPAVAVPLAIEVED